MLSWTIAECYGVFLYLSWKKIFVLWASHPCFGVFCTRADRCLERDEGIIRASHDSGDEGPEGFAARNCWLAHRLAFYKTPRITIRSQPPAAVPATGQWNPDLIFSILAEPARRHLLLALAHGKPAPATALQGATQLRLDATLKHLTAMRSAGLLMTSPDPQDGRRTLYTLAPSVPVKKTPEGGTVIDFGFVLLRL
ncbi:MAG: helix-turn-helix domain-containing protein [Verrucomicrobiae bacterium]|nr:helix-turn-helix domain-containing protein [Verrucomicrobiae bacterium]